MDILATIKKFFPLSFRPKKDMTALIITVVIYLVASFLIGIIGTVIMGLIGGLEIPILNILLGFFGELFGLVINVYAIGGAVLACLDYFKILKD